MILVAVDDGSFIVLAVVALILVGIVYGFYTRQGSGIDSHPHDGSDGAPGAKGPGEPSGSDQGEGSALDDHGAK